MPKLPQKSKTSVLEVLDKKNYSTGEITYPKAPRHRIVFKHHLKLSLVLIAVVVMLGLVFVVGKLMLDKPGVEETSSASGDLAKFQAPNETNLKYPNLEYVVTIRVDKVDVENKLIYGKQANFEGENVQFVDFIVRVLDTTTISESVAQGELIEGTEDTKMNKTTADISAGDSVFVLATEDPKTNKYLNARNLEIK